MALRSGIAIAFALVFAPVLARADAIPIVTLGDAGPDQEVPADRAFYVAGDAPATRRLVQVAVVRKGSPSMFGDDGPSCRAIAGGLRVDAATTSDDEDDETAPDARPKLPPGLHAAFELFPRADAELRDAAVLVTAPWRRDDDEARRYQVLVPHDAHFFSAGYAYCLVVVTTDRAQHVDDAVIVDTIDSLGKKLVACGDKSACHDDALDEFEARAIAALSSNRTLSPGEVNTIAGKLKTAARDELAAAATIVEARDHLDERWRKQLDVIEPTATAVWLDTAKDPFARAVTALLARGGALIPHVVAAGKGTTAVPYTSDGRIAVKALQLFDDGRSIRVASSQAPARDQAHVVAATTDELAVADDVTVLDLLELGRGKVRVDREWIALAALGDRVAKLGGEWSSEESGYLAAAGARLHRLADFVETAMTGAKCGDARADTDGEHRALGEWLACRHADADKLEALAQQLDELGAADRGWRTAKDKLAARVQRIATVATTAPLPTRVGFHSRTWLFSYVTPVVGYAGVLRPDESFGLFYVGVQIHLEPNPVGDIPWRDGVTARDLRRAFALELAIAPYGGTFGPDNRYSGFGGVPPIFLGLAAHVIPYTSFTIGGTIVDRRRSSLVEEQPQAVFAPYIGVAIQLNLPDLIRSSSRPTTGTAVDR